MRSRTLVIIRRMIAMLGAPFRRVSSCTIDGWIAGRRLAGPYGMIGCLPPLESRATSMIAPAVRL